MITVVDVLRVFPGSKVTGENKPLRCDNCVSDHVPEWRRGGKIVSGHRQTVANSGRVITAGGRGSSWSIAREPAAEN